MGDQPLKTYIDRISQLLASPRLSLAAEFGGRFERHLAKRVGVIQFGVNHVLLEAGAASSRRHWHEREDEFVYVLRGKVCLCDENGDHELVEGEFAGFPAGAANGHHFVNRSDEPVELLVVGTRKVGAEMIHYPDQDDPGPVVVVRDERGTRSL